MAEEKLTEESCPKCGALLGPITETKTGKQLRRCSAGNWNAELKQVEGCDYVKWITPEPKALDEKCPKCGAPLMMVTTRFGKKMKRCSTNKWDPKTKTSIGCDYVEWINTSATEELEEECPKCGSKLVLYTTGSGKTMKKCSTSKWDPKTRTASGCDFIEWLN